MRQINELASLREKVRRRKPLVHHITNIVVANFTANGHLACGASPVMANAREEVAEMASQADALVLNIGTLNESVVESMLLAGKAANLHGVPVVLDPVGAGATAYRTETARRLINEIDISAVRGNAAEIAHASGIKWEIRGVDAGEGTIDPGELAKHAAKVFGCVVAVTGPVDCLSDGKRISRVGNGDPMMGMVTGTGCLLTGLIGAFLAVEKDALTAATAAVLFYGVAGERAAIGNPAPGSYQVRLLDELWQTGEAEILEKGNVSFGGEEYGS